MPAASRSKRSHRSSYHSRRSPFAALWLILGMGVVYVMFVVTAETPPPMETEARKYPGSARDVPSQVLPKTAREASEEFHRTYDNPEEPAEEGDPIAESRRRNREKAQQQQAQQQQQQPRQNDARQKKQKEEKPTSADVRKKRR